MPYLGTPELHITSNETGAQHSHPVLLLHGWPDDATTWDAVLPRLQDRKLRRIAPYPRGFGPTTFRHDRASRAANGAILAMDAIALMDGLGIERFSVVGHDWGSNIAEGLATGWPLRVDRMALLSSLPRMGGLKTPPFRKAQRYWYHWFMVTKRGEEAISKDPHGFARLQWENWSPDGWLDEATFNAVAKSFGNPDWVAVTLHSYRVWWGEAEPDPASLWLEDRIRETRSLSLLTVYFQGVEDGVDRRELSENPQGKFTGLFERIALQNVEHFPHWEDVDTVARELAVFRGSDLKPARKK